MATICITHREWLNSKPLNADQVTISNLRTVANSGYDAWGRPKAQPVSISIRLHLAQSTSPAANDDSVNSSTVHYGSLSKLLLSRIEQHKGQWLSPDDLGQILISAALEAPLNPSIVAALEMDICFEKASQFGRGITLQLHHTPQLKATAPVMCLSNVRYPALVGVNPHERVMKQAVDITIWVDRMKPHISNEYYEIEQLLTKTVEESSFETLESLSEAIAGCIIKFFVFAKLPMPLESLTEPVGIRIRIEKPGAILLADAPAVEIFRTTDPNSAFGKRVLGELGNKRPQIPFPLNGRLDEFVQSWKQD